MTTQEIMEIVYRLNVYEPCHLAVDAERRIFELVSSIEAVEREKCAKLCEQVAQISTADAHDCAAIRLRGFR